LLLVSLCLNVITCVPAYAGDEAEPDHSFFSYLPAAPKFRLPNLDIVPFWTSDLKIARKAYRSGKYERALIYFRKASEDGNATADWFLGHMYRLGRGVPVDHSVAYSYYSRVAETYGSDEADTVRMGIAVDCQLRLANYQLTGVAASGIKPNPEAATRTYLRLASNYGHPAAMFALGKTNIEGLGMQKNPAQGLKWLMAAARKRNVEAQAYLGDLYEVGEIVRRDETRSLMWYILAAESAGGEHSGPVHLRLEQKIANASDDVRLEADARARVFSDQFPAPAMPQD
jgi:hypothetical protein